MFDFLKRRKKQEEPGKFVSLLRVMENTDLGTATPGKLIPFKHSKEEREYEVFLQDSPSWWTITSGSLLDEEYFPLKNSLRYFVGGGVTNIGSVTTNQKFKMMTNKGYKTFWVDENGMISS